MPIDLAGWPNNEVETGDCEYERTAYLQFIDQSRVERKQRSPEADTVTSWGLRIDGHMLIDNKT